jgi:hypothetical protein
MPAPQSSPQTNPAKGLTPLKPMGAVSSPGAKPAHMQPRPPAPGQPNFQGMQPGQPQQAGGWKPSVVAQIAAEKGDARTAMSQGAFKPQAAPMKTAAGANPFADKKLKKPKLAPTGSKLLTADDIAKELGKAAAEFTQTHEPDPYARLMKLLGHVKANPIPSDIPAPVAGEAIFGHGSNNEKRWDISNSTFGRDDGAKLHDTLAEASSRPKPWQDWRSALLGAGGVAAIGGLGYGAHKLLSKPKKKPEETADSLGKAAARVAFRDPLPADWNGTVQMPSFNNGGIASFGPDAWHSVNHTKPSWAPRFDIRKDFNVTHG